MARRPAAATAAAPALSGLSAVLASIYAAQATAGHAMLTEAEGREAVEQGFAELVEGVIDGDKAGVRLTEAGMARVMAEAGQNQGSDTQAGSAGNDTVSGGASGGFVIEDYVPTAQARRGGRGNTIYPFDSLNVNQSFHVPATAENPNPAKSLASTVSSATARYAEVIPGEFETVTLPVYQTGPDGKKTKDANGNWIKTGEKTETRPKVKKTRIFSVVAVGDEDPKGKGARVLRTQ